MTRIIRRYIDNLKNDWKALRLLLTARATHQARPARPDALPTGHRVVELAHPPSGARRARRSWCRPYGTPRNRTLIARSARAPVGCSAHWCAAPGRTTRRALKPTRGWAKHPGRKYVRVCAAQRLLRCTSLRDPVHPGRKYIRVCAAHLCASTRPKVARDGSAYRSKTDGAAHTGVP